MDTTPNPSPSSQGDGGTVGDQPAGGVIPALRAAGFLIVYLVVTLLSIGIAGTVIGEGGVAGLARPGRFSAGSLIGLALYQAVACVLVLSLAVVFTTRVDRRPLGDLGFSSRRRGRELLLGIGYALCMVALIFAASMAAGWSQVTGSSFSDDPSGAVRVFGFSVLLMALVSISEETAMRGYVTRTLAAGYGRTPALIAGSVVFGALHAGNPGSALPSFLGTAAAGLFLGYAFLKTGRLWFSAGFHFAWNLALGPIFGFPVSGAGFPGLVIQRLHGPALWTGGEFGPEAGLFTPVVLILGILLLRSSEKAGIAYLPDEI